MNTCRVFIEHAEQSITVQAENGELSNLSNLFQQQQQHETFSCVNAPMFTAVRRNLGKVLLFQFSVLRMSWLNTLASQLASGSGCWHDCFKQMNFLHHPVDFSSPFIQLFCFFLSLESFVLLHMSTCDFWTNFPVRCGFFLVSFKITCCALGMISAGYSRLKKEEAALNFFHL